MPIKSIRREMRFLRYYSLAITLIAGTFLLAAAHEASSNATIDTLTVHRINVVDREGKLAVVVTSHDDFPPPIVNGKALKRSSGDDNGLLFYNERGDEQGGLTWGGLKNPDGTFESSNTLSFDSVVTDQLLQVDDGNANGKTYAYMIGWNRPRYDSPEMMSVIQQVENAKTTDEKRAIIAQHPELRSATRFLFGYDPENTAQVMLADGKGKARIKMFVTDNGQAELQFLDADGNVVAQYPQATK
ncbi:MAG TPA: hypothetical protein VK702_10860 [Candidatus Acidoferrum sp.]|jgi:hypothetical protein|nr:hypothetical protein [Candidatus Acidoferrum sp.]